MHFIVGVSAAIARASLNLLLLAVGRLVAVVRETELLLPPLRGSGCDFEEEIDAALGYPVLVC